MIQIAAIVRGAKLLYPIVVTAYELIRDEVRKSGEPPPQPLPYRDVEHIRKQIDSATKFRVPRRPTGG
jgi:hypothetical protein